MAYGGYGRNSPDYSHTQRPYTPAPADPVPPPIRSTPVTPAPTDPLPPPIRTTPSPRVEPAPKVEKEHCTCCGKAVEADFLVCPYCRNDLEAARAARRSVLCACGAARVAVDKHCFKCGTAFPPNSAS